MDFGEILLFLFFSGFASFLFGLVLFVLQHQLRRQLPLLHQILLLHLLLLLIPLINLIRHPLPLQIILLTILLLLPLLHLLLLGLSLPILRRPLRLHHSLRQGAHHEPLIIINILLEFEFRHFFSDEIVAIDGFSEAPAGDAF